MRRLLSRTLSLLLSLGLLAGVPAGYGEPLPFMLPTPAEEPVFTQEPLPAAYRAAMTGISWKKGAPVSLDGLRLVKVGYMGFDGRSMQGELVMHQAVAEEVLAIFSELYDAGYPIRRISVVDWYGADDTRSMEADNTSAFNFRPVSGSVRLSRHSYGIAIDINPVENPYIKGDYLSPAVGKPYRDRSLAGAGMIIPGDPCHLAFVNRGWVWGGDWKTLKDYQHFEKPLNVKLLK